MKKPGSGVSAKACPASALAALAAAVLVLAAAFALAGCSAGMPAGPDVAPAFGDPYQEAEEAVRAHADDAALLGVRTDGNVALDEQRPWVYLFGSKRTGYSYSVQTTDGNVVVEEYAPLSLTHSQWDAIEKPDDVSVEARQAVAEAVEASGKAPTSYNASLVTFEDTSGRAGLKPMVWYVGLVDLTEDGEANTELYEVAAR